MNRRGFIGIAAKALAAFSILPTATTYARQWKPVSSGMWVPNPEYFTPYEYMGEWRFIVGLGFQDVPIENAKVDHLMNMGMPLIRYVPVEEQGMTIFKRIASH